jgi:hypothetical protein
MKLSPIDMPPPAVVIQHGQHVGRGFARRRRHEPDERVVFQDHELGPIRHREQLDDSRQF